MVALTVLQQLIALFLISLAAFILTKKGMLDAHMTKGLSMLLTSVSMPAMMLSSMQVPYSPALLQEFGVTCLGLAITVTIGIVLVIPFARLRKISAREMGAWMCCAAFPNSIFIGKPIMLALFGEAAQFSITALFFTFSVLSFSVGITLLTIGGNTSGESPVRLFLKNLCSPAIVAGVIGFALFLGSVSLPGPVLNALEMMGATVTPISMLIIGFSLGGISFRELVGDGRVYLLSALRLVACPLLTLLVLKPFISNPMVLGVLMISAAMPTASMVGVLSERYQNEPVLTSKVIFISTLLCIITAPLVSLLIQV